MKLQVNLDEKSESFVDLEVNRMPVEDFINTQILMGQKIKLEKGVAWREVRPCFYRPVVYFQKFKSGEIEQPFFSKIGGVQYAVSDGEESNSTINYWAFGDLQRYSMDSLSRSNIRGLRKAIRHFRIKQINSSEELVKGHQAYISFYDRTKYGVRTDRTDPKSFTKWAEEVFQFPSLVIGAYEDGNSLPEGVLISRVVGNAMIGSTYFETTKSLKNHLSDLLIHVLRNVAAKVEGVEQIVIAPYSPGGRVGLDDFYRARGAKLVQIPSKLNLNPMTKSLLRKFAPNQLARLEGRLS